MNELTSGMLPAHPFADHGNGGGELDEKRVEKKVEREETVVKKGRPIAGKKVTNVNVGPDGTTNIQESSDVDEVVETVERRDTTVERRESR
jgi:uncharacterized membrane protein YjjP (DUF1212 family)